MGPGELNAIEKLTHKCWERASLSALRWAILQRRRERGSRRAYRRYSRALLRGYFTLAYRSYRLEPNYPGPEVVTTTWPASAVVAECWWLTVATIDRVRLDELTRETWESSTPRISSPSNGRSSGGGACWRCRRGRRRVRGAPNVGDLYTFDPTEAEGELSRLHPRSESRR